MAHLTNNTPLPAGNFDRIAKFLPFLAVSIAGVQLILALIHLYFPAQLPHLRIPSAMSAGKVALALQVLAILALMIYIGPPPTYSSDAKFRHAVAASRQFYWVWMGLWVMWLCLYLDWLVAWPSFLSNKESFITHLSFDGFNLLSSSMLYLCYVLMVERSESEFLNNWYRGMIHVFVACILLIGAEAVVTSMWIGTREYFDSLQGLLSGVAIALFVGRLESIFIDSPRYIIALLYGYAVLQFSYPLLEDGKSDTGSTFILITSIALLLKVLLCWHVKHISMSGRLPYYMLRYRKIYDESPEEAENTLQELLAR